MSRGRPKIAFWFRYGAAEHAELLHALPDLIEALSQHVEVHYYGPRSLKPVPERIRAHAVLHTLPYAVDRTSHRQKIWKTLLWLAILPFIGLHSRWIGVRAVYIDETIPLATLLARTFFGGNVAVTVVDMFVDIYLTGSAWQRKLAQFIRNCDLASWRRSPLLFTRARSTREFLVRHSIPPERIVPVYDPCDFETYHPTDKARARAQFGFSPQHVVLVHHGILHPNKGNDWILRAIAPLREQCPELRYLLVGDGPEMSRLKQLTQELGLEDRVIFTGWLKTPRDVNEALNAGDIGLVMRVGHPSDNFHLTGALVHSMACGLPILAARLAGVSEIIQDGVNGFLFDTRSPDEFQEKLLRLARDPALRERFGQAVLSEARERFAIETFTQQTVRPLLELAGVELPPQ